MGALFADGRSAVHPLLVAARYAVPASAPATAHHAALLRPSRRLLLGIARLCGDGAALLGLRGSDVVRRARRRRKRHGHCELHLQARGSRGREAHTGGLVVLTLERETGEQKQSEQVHLGSGGGQREAGEQVVTAEEARGPGSTLTPVRTQKEAAAAT